MSFVAMQARLRGGTPFLIHTPEYYASDEIDGVAWVRVTLILPAC